MKTLILFIMMLSPVFGWGATCKSTDTVPVATIEAMISSGQYDQAAVSLEKVLKDCPQSVKAQTYYQQVLPLTSSKYRKPWSPWEKAVVAFILMVAGGFIAWALYSDRAAKEAARKRRQDAIEDILSRTLAVRDAIEEVLVLKATALGPQTKESLSSQRNRAAELVEICVKKPDDVNLSLAERFLQDTESLLESIA